MAKAREVVTLGELARELDMNKSHLHYWVKRGIISPDVKLSNVFLFPRARTITRIKKINLLREKGMTLKDVFEKLK
jgi:DNA-binding transcriptional MerR regulator